MRCSWAWPSRHNVHYTCSLTASRTRRTGPPSFIRPPRRSLAPRVAIYFCGQVLGERPQHLQIVTTAPREVALAEGRPRKAGGGLVDLRRPSCRWGGSFDRTRHRGVASPRIPRRFFHVLHLRLPALLRRTGITPRRCVSSFCLNSAVSWLGGDSVPEIILKILSSEGGKTRTGSLEHSGPVW